LKADYANAHYNFAQALIKLNDPTNAKRELEITKTLVAQGSADYQKVEQDLAALSQAPTVAGAQNNKPTVEQLAGQNQPQQPVNQEPLTNPTSTGTQNLNIEALPQGAQVGTTQPANTPVQN